MQLVTDTKLIQLSRPPKFERVLTVYVTEMVRQRRLCVWHAKTCPQVRMKVSIEFKLA